MDIDCLDKSDDSNCDVFVSDVFYASIVVVCMHCTSESQLPTFRILVGEMVTIISAIFLQLLIYKVLILSKSVNNLSIIFIRYYSSIT